MNNIDIDLLLKSVIKLHKLNPYHKEYSKYNRLAAILQPMVFNDSVLGFRIESPLLLLESVKDESNPELRVWKFNQTTLYYLERIDKNIIPDPSYNSTAVKSYF